MNEQPRSTFDPATTALPFMGMSIALSSLYFGTLVLRLAMRNAPR